MGMYEFNPGDAMRFARWYGARTRQIGDELRFAECPYCKGRGHDKDVSFGVFVNAWMPLPKVYRREETES